MTLNLEVTLKILKLKYLLKVNGDNRKLLDFEVAHIFLLLNSKNIELLFSKNYL